MQSSLVSAQGLGCTKTRVLLRVLWWLASSQSLVGKVPALPRCSLRGQGGLRTLNPKPWTLKPKP